MALVLPYIAPSGNGVADRIIPVESTVELLDQKKCLLKMGCYTVECNTLHISVDCVVLCFQRMLCEFGKQGMGLKMASSTIIFSGPLGGNLCFPSHSSGLPVFKSTGSRSRMDLTRRSSKISIDFKLCLLPGHFKLLGQGDQIIKKNNLPDGGD